MGTFPEHRARRTFRARRTVTALALGAVAGCVGLVQAGAASAEVLPSVHITVDGNDSNPKAHWGEAWDACQKEAANTRSIHFKHVLEGPAGDGDSLNVQEWECDDQP
jgi:hypothetical protein